MGKGVEAPLTASTIDCGNTNLINSKTITKEMAVNRKTRFFINQKLFVMQFLQLAKLYKSFIKTILVFGKLRIFLSKI
jgi:hypothetical protein